MLFLSLFLILINLKLDSHDYLFKAHVRPREIFRGFLALCFLMNDFHLVKYVPKLGVQKGYGLLLDLQLQSVFYQVKIFPNDPKLLGHSGIGPNISKIIGPKFRAA